MGGWEILAWLAVALVTVLRVALVVGIVAIVVAIVRGVRAYQPASRASSKLKSSSTGPVPGFVL